MQLTVQQLESALWDAANTLRGSAVDRTDWKGYILPLLFFKRISDCWDEETAEAAELYGDADPSHFEEVHRFQVPEGYINSSQGKVRDAGTSNPLGRRVPKEFLPKVGRCSRIFSYEEWSVYIGNEINDNTVTSFFCMGSGETISFMFGICVNDDTWIAPMAYLVCAICNTLSSNGDMKNKGFKFRYFHG